jgi:thiosulfate dehydrogenase
MKTFVFGMLAGASALALGAVLYLRLGVAEVRGDLAPGVLESKFMTAAVHASVRREAPELPNPVAPTDENLISGGKMFANECAGCHGRPGSSEDNGNTLFPPVPQLHKVGTEYTEAQIFWIAKHGIRRTGMFSNGGWHTDQELWTVAAYVKRMRGLPPAVQTALQPKKTGALN